ncbi:hypothetical protein KBB48_03130 [Candidatus Shapirobacteria bacterium]|nr:hypothetical protein [Candidatus Shapirobacteria bacterium]
MGAQKSDPLAKIVFVALWLILIVVVYLLIKNNPFKGLEKIKIEAPIKPSPTIVEVTPTQRPVSPSPTKIPPTLVPIKAAISCNRFQITEPGLLSNKCYSLADYKTLVSVWPKYLTAKSQLQFANKSIEITCDCQNERSCEFFKKSCTKDREDKARAEADLNLYRTQLELLIARGW